MARRKRSFIKGRLRWKLVGSLCAGDALLPPSLAAFSVVALALRLTRTVSRSLALVSSYAVFLSLEGVSDRLWRVDPGR